jgi:hypothetical protein
MPSKPESRRRDRRHLARRRTWRIDRAARCGSTVGWLLLVCCLLSGTLRADTFAEQEVRAVFLYNFALFAQWPLKAFDAPDSPIRYCLLGNRGLRKSLATVLAKELVEGHPLKLMPAEFHDWSACHVLYIDHGTPASQTADALRAARGAPVLTIGDSEAFARRGGMVGLVRKGGRVRTVINTRAVDEAGIRISSKLLRMSQLISGEKQTDSP